MSQNSPGLPPTDPSDGPATYSGSRVLALVVVLLLVVGIGWVGFRAWQGQDDDATGEPTAQPQTAEPHTSEVPGPSDPRLREFYSQKLRWKDCGGNECATFEVPLDYDDPTGKKVSISALKVPAADPKQRIGSLVVNPGGPGGSGIEYAQAGSLQFGDVLSSRYDIVGFDPRGVGRSTPIKCLDTEDLDAVVSFDPDPDTADERHELDDLYKRFGEGCVKESGDLTRHISTVEVARDMDVLRGLLHEGKLDYMGASYGTYIGATYAELFPKNVGRFVLDGAVDPSLSSRQLSLEQAKGFETALRAYLADCVHGGDCVLGDSVSAGEQRLTAFYEELERKPLPTGDDDRPLTAGLGMIGTWLPLYVKSYWSMLSDALEAALDKGDGSKLLDLADLYLSRGSDGYSDNSMEALTAVNCLDHGDSVVVDDVPRQFEAFEAASPVFGKAFAFGLATCAEWPVKGDRPAEQIHARGAAPIVVVGTTRDPATPLKWAVGLARQLASGRLIVRDGDGHTGFNQGNDCVDNAVEGFLVDGKVPPKRLEC